MNLARRLDDARESIGPVGTAARVHAHPIIALTHHEPVAVVLDFVDPIRPTGAAFATVGMQGSMKPEAGRTLVLYRHRMASNIVRLHPERPENLPVLKSLENWPKSNPRNLR